MARPPNNIPQIHRTQRTTFRRHYLKEWLEARKIDPMDLVRALNEPEDMSEAPVDKSQVYRWIKGQLPQGKTLIRLAAVLELLDVETGEPDPELLISHPNQSWIAMRVKDLPKEEVDTVKKMLDLWLVRRASN